MPFIVYDKGFTFATACSQPGILSIGKKALLAKVNGRFSRFMTAMGVSILVDLMLMAMNSEDKPKHIRNRNANTPSILSGVNAAPTWKPSGTAIINIIAAWNIDRNVAESTLDTIITERDTGVLRTLFRKPKRLSQTTDMPLNIVVKSAVKAIIPTAINEI
jgi:hypothetical protein